MQAREAMPSLAEAMSPFGFCASWVIAAACWMSGAEVVAKLGFEARMIRHFWGLPPVVVKSVMGTHNF